MKKILVIGNFIILFLLNISAYAQNSSLYIPLNIQNAYTKGTRSYDGKPGGNYWQNHSDYKIKVYFNPTDGKLTGSEKITYYNESPDTLHQLIIRLYQNITKPEAQRDFDISKDILSDGVNIESMSINGLSLNLNDKAVAPGIGTNWTVNLPERLAPKSKVDLQIGWDFTIKKGKNIRMGYYSDSTYFVGYWYPQIAVYDDIDGWDRTAYTGQTEFYNDFCNYDVEISVPKSITIWATGIMQNTEEIFMPEYLQRYKAAMTSDEVVKIIGLEDLHKQKYIGGDTITWKYKAEHVPDFAFAISNKYLWDAVSVVADNKTKRRVLISAAYSPASKDFYEVADIARKTIEMLSDDFPAVPFPYPRMTVFNGGGGMEYPMIVNDGSASEKYITVHVTSHEITHTYFPFYMGTNERKYAWMDEGWANMIPFNIQSTIDPAYDPVAKNVENYLVNAGKEIEVPPVTLSYQMRYMAYRLASYYRPAEAYELLRETLGKEKFDNALREFIKRWNGKHPMPYDFFFTFNNVTGGDLGWFWKPWFFEEGYPDLGIKEVKVEKEKINILIEKIGNIPIPVSIKVTNEDSSKVYVNKDLSIWKPGSKEVWVEVENKGTPLMVELGNNKIPDVNLRNNIYYLKRVSVQ